MVTQELKRVVDNRIRNYGDSHLGTGIIRINKKRIKKTPHYKRPVNKHAHKYPELLDTIVHEKYHLAHPRAKEKTVWKKARQKVKTMPKAEKRKLYRQFAKRPITKSKRKQIYREYQKVGNKK